ncbi:MAG TPA: adenylate kinase [Clostridia bacterium]|nr:adenylate kinase [Clostridia bacterium]
MKLILLGAPGAGKGSQATKIAAEYGIAHISTGDALRANIAKGTALGVNAKSFIDKGQLVPDDVVVGIVADRIKQDDCKKGFLLDGFPRTIAQAEELSNLTDIDYVINLVVDFEIVKARISGRRMCSCGESYHTSTYTSDTCQKCGGKLYQRADDNEETVANRLEVYSKQTAPLVNFYKNIGKLVDVDGNKTINELFEDIKAILNGNN